MTAEAEDIEVNNSVDLYRAAYRDGCEAERREIVAYIRDTAWSLHAACRFESGSIYSLAKAVEDGRHIKKNEEKG